MNQNRKPWARMPDEPGLWFERFDLWRSLGPSRTIEEAFQRDRAKRGLKAERPHFRWYEVRKDWDWDARAEAWDAFKAEESRRLEIEAEKEALQQARQDRRELMDGFTGTIATALVNYTQSMDRLTGLVDYLQDQAQRCEDEDRRDLLLQRVGEVSHAMAELSALPDVTKAMEMLVKQMRTEFGDFIIPERQPAQDANDDDPHQVPQDDTLRIIVYD